MRKPVGRLHESNAGVAKDPLGELMKILYDVYQNPVGGGPIWTSKYRRKIFHHPS